MAAGSAGVARWHVDYVANIPIQDVVAEFSSGGPPGAPPGGPPGAPSGAPPGAPPVGSSGDGGPPPGFPSEGPPIPNDPELREFFDVLFRSAIISDLVYLLTLPYYRFSPTVSEFVVANPR